MNTCLAVQQVLFWETTIIFWGTFMGLQIKESFLLTPKDGMRLKPQRKASLRTFPRAIREDTIAISMDIISQERTPFLFDTTLGILTRKSSPDRAKQGNNKKSQSQYPDYII